VVVLDHLSLLVATVLRAHALAAKEKPLEKAVELLALVCGGMNSHSQLLIGEVAE
jgi:hypothetical protein